jgi:hypothetical protein
MIMWRLGQYLRATLVQWIVPRLLELTRNGWNLEPFAKDQLNSRGADRRVRRRGGIYAARYSLP